MSRHTIYFVLAVSLFALSGCLQNVKSRECSTFNHPLAKQWQPVESGNSIVFTNADGESAVYLLKSITLSEPYSEPYIAKIDVNSSALDTPQCKMTSNHLFVADDGSHEITLDFVQRDADGINPAENSLAVRILANLPSVESGEQISRTRYKNLLTLDTVVDNDDTLQPQFFTDQTLENGQTFIDVIEFPGISFPSDPEYEQYSLNKVLLSRNVGLIQISRDDGGVFTLVP